MTQLLRPSSDIKRVPLVKPDLPSFDEVAEAFRQALDSGRVTNFGQNMQAFEQTVGEYVGAGVVAVSSATVGLLFSLQALGLKRGQKVILPSFTFSATAQAIEYAGGVPVFADIEDDLNISVSDLAMLLDREDDVAVVMPVHIYGVPCRVDEIQALVDAYGQRHNRKVSVLYDAAHGLGSALGDRRVGSFGDAEVFSLSATKLLVSIEGGLIASRDEDFLRRLRTMRNYGLENYDAKMPGLNAKMSELHAIVGLHNARRLPELVAQRQELARHYAAQISEKTVLTPMVVPEGVLSTYKDFTIMLPPAMKEHRAAIMDQLAALGVETRAYFFPAVHEQQYFRHYADRALPITEDLSRRVLTLPFFTQMTHEEVDHVVGALRDVEQAFA